MKMDMLRKMRMPASKGAAADDDGKKDGMMVAIGLGKPKDEDGDDDAEKDEALAKFSEMDLLEELKDRGCVDDEQFDAISSHIKSKASAGADGKHEDSSEGDEDGPSY